MTNSFSYLLLSQLARNSSSSQFFKGYSFVKTEMANKPASHLVKMKVNTAMLLCISRITNLSIKIQTIFATMFQI